MINWVKIKSTYFWVDLSPFPLTNATVKSGLILFGGFLVAGFFCSLMRKVKIKQKVWHEVKLWEKLRGLFSVMGTAGLMLTWFGYEGVYLLSARFWYIIWLVVLLGWFTYIMRDFRKKRPVISTGTLAWRLKQKYLP